ncbi:MAG: YkvA family protein [Bacillota bacterium]
MKAKTFETWKQRARQLKIEIYTIYLACRDPRVPWHVRLLAACLAGYAFSPIDLVPDFVPLLGYIDDLVLIPLGITLVLKMIPNEVLAECREKAGEVMSRGKPASRAAAGFIIAIWLTLAMDLYFQCTDF